jgi:uncharacterized protein YqhQ
MPILESGEETLVGGQAVMEGVMMRAPHSYCVAVRKSTGEIVTEEAPLARMSEQYKIFKYPIFRGIGTLYQALKLGGRALKFSASVIEVPAEGAKPAKELPAWAAVLPVLASVAFFVFAYKFLPQLLVNKLTGSYPALAGNFANSAGAGAIRIVIFLLVLFSISRFKDIKRVFEYHGAEHKVVFNFESGQPVTVASAQKFTTFHPRCGTSFLFVVFVLAIPIYALIPFPNMAAKVASQVALMPLVSGIAYELIRFAAKRQGSFLAMLAAPGLWMQRITTQPPADDQAAVAIHALEGAMALEKSQGGELVIA